MVIISARNVIILREKISLDLEIFVLGVYKKEYPGKSSLKQDKRGISKKVL